MENKKLEELKKKFPNIDEKAILEIYLVGVSDGIKSQKIEVEALKMKIEKLKSLEDDGK